jgi:hypothetical protein
VTDERVFTVEEADAELDELRERLPRLREARDALIASSRRISDAVASDGGGVAGSEWFSHQEALKTEVLFLADHGILAARPRHRARGLPGGARGPARLPVLEAGGGPRRLVPRSERRVRRAPSAMTDRPILAVFRASPEDPLPGIAEADPLADLRFADDVDALRRAVADADALFMIKAPQGLLEDAWGAARRLRWIQTASDGVDLLLFPALVESGVTITNARGCSTRRSPNGRSARCSRWRRGSIDRSWRRRSAAGMTTAGRNGSRARLLVLGPGPIGRATARRARDLGMSVAAVRARAAPRRPLRAVGGPDDLHAMLADADVVFDAAAAHAGDPSLRRRARVRGDAGRPPGS